MTKIDEILEERGKTHGPFKKHAAISQGLKMASMFCKDGTALTNVQQEAIDMILHKVARILNGKPEHIDHWDDIAGYATLGTPEPSKLQPSQNSAFVPTFSYMLKIAAMGNLTDLPDNLNKAVTRILADCAGIMSNECNGTKRWDGIVNAATRVSFDLSKGAN